LSGRWGYLMLAPKTPPDTGLFRNPSKKYAPVFSRLQEYLSRLREQTFVLNTELTYFNSGRSKTLADMFDSLAEADTARNIILRFDTTYLFYIKKNISAFHAICSEFFLDCGANMC